MQNTFIDRFGLPLGIQYHGCRIPCFDSLLCLEHLHVVNIIGKRFNCGSKTHVDSLNCLCNWCSIDLLLLTVRCVTRLLVSCCRLLDNDQDNETHTCCNRCVLGHSTVFLSWAKLRKVKYCDLSACPESSKQNDVASMVGQDRLSVLPAELRLQIYRFLVPTDREFGYEPICRPQKYLISFRRRQKRPDRFRPNSSPAAMRLVNKLFNAEISWFAESLVEAFLRDNFFWVPPFMCEEPFIIKSNLMQHGFQYLTRVIIGPRVRFRYPGTARTLGPGWRAVERLPSLRLLRIHLRILNVPRYILLRDWMVGPRQTRRELYEPTLLPCLPWGHHVVRLPHRLVVQVQFIVLDRPPASTPRRRRGVQPRLQPVPPEGQTWVTRVSLEVTNIGSDRTLWVPSPSVRVEEIQEIRSTARRTVASGTDRRSVEEIHLPTWEFYSAHLATMTNTAREMGHIAVAD